MPLSREKGSECMSEINRNEFELNEAELEDISGGSHTPIDGPSLNRALGYCDFCDRSTERNCKRYKDLARYISQNGYVNITRPSLCPFYND